MRFLLAAGFAISLAGCAGGGLPSADQINADLAQMTVADLDAALIDARAHNDGVAIMCYEALLPLVKTIGLPSAPVGLVDAFQQLRDVNDTGPAAVALLKALEIPCGPLAVDSAITLAQLINQFVPK